MSRLHRNRAKRVRHDGPILDALEYHRKIKKRWKEWNKEHYSGKRFKKRKTPWYIMTSGKQYNYEERMLSWGACIDYFRVPSEAKCFTAFTTLRKITHNQYKNRLIQAKLDDWVRKHPRPIPKDSKEKDLFESFFMLPWIDEHTQAREKIVDFVNNIGSKVFVYARYIDDIGYPRKIMEFRSDHQKLMILDGKYANRVSSKTIKRAQNIANNLALFNPKFVSLKVVDGNQECILIPYRRLDAVA